MPVAIRGTGGGSVTLTAGAAAADTTLTLPNTTGTVINTAPSTSGNVLTSNGTAWTSAAPAAPAALSTASGSAPSYSARAWVNFNGTGTVAIRASGNVSSITDNGLGDYRVNFTTAMPDANYARCATAGALAVGTASNIQSPYYTTPTTSALGVTTFNTDWSSPQDCNDINVAIFR